jgi:hypothetical protein
MLTLMTVLAAGALTAAPVRVETPMMRPCPTVEVRKAGELRTPRRLVFSARHVGDLEFVLTYPRRLTGRRVELKLYTPRGHLYQTLSETLGPLRHRHAPGQVSLRLPVSGTLIEQSALFGKWSVEPVLDGTPTACHGGGHFTLTR